MHNSDLSGKNESSKCKHANQMNLSTSLEFFSQRKLNIFLKAKLETGKPQISDNYCSVTLKKVDLILSCSVYKVPFTMRNLILNSPEKVILKYKNIAYIVKVCFIMSNEPYKTVYKDMIYQFDVPFPLDLL